MKNNTKIRLHLSKQLFESLTKQVIAEAKGKHSYGAGMEEVKMPKAKKERVEEAGDVPKKGVSSSTFAKDLRQKATELPSMKGLSTNEIGKMQKLLNTILTNAIDGDISVAIDRAQKALDTAIPEKGGKLPAPPKEERPGGPFFEMETMTAETEALEEWTHLAPGGIFAQITNMLPFLVVAAGGIAALVTKLKKQGVPDEEIKKVVDAAKAAEKTSKA